MANFIVSTDSCADLRKSYLAANNIYCIPIKRIVNEQEIAEIFETDEDFEKFYEELKSGVLPTTTQLNPFELKDFFEDILKKEKSGDLIHICLSSGLSNTYNNAVTAADEINKSHEKSGDKRRVYIFDSLIATVAQGWQVEEFVEYRDNGVSTTEALEKLEHMRTHQQAWVIMSDLFHLKRGGRISGAKAAIGTVLNIRPIIHLSTKGKLPIENKMRGNVKAMKYVLSRMEKYGEKFDKDFGNSTVMLIRTSHSEMYEQMKQSITSVYPGIKIREGIVGPVIGTHLGGGAVAVLFNGAPRLDLKS